MNAALKQPKFNAHACSRARRLAVQAIYQWQLSGTKPAVIRVEFIAREDNQGYDRALFDELLAQVPAETEMLDALLQPELDRPLEEVDPVERAILRIGAYELARRVETPWKVVINEAVNLTRKFGATDSHAYINAVLDRVAGRVRPEASGNRR